MKLVLVKGTRSTKKETTPMLSESNIFIYLKHKRNEKKEEMAGVKSATV